MQTSQLLMLGVRQLPACTFACASSCNPESLRNLTGAQFDHAVPPTFTRGILLMSEQRKKLAKVMFYDDVDRTSCW